MKAHKNHTREWIFGEIETDARGEKFNKILRNKYVESHCMWIFSRNKSNKKIGNAYHIFHFWIKNLKQIVQQKDMLPFESDCYYPH